MYIDLLVYFPFPSYFITLTDVHLQKFDAVTRFGIKDGGLSFFSDISLVLIDEVHLLNDPRGAALEAIVSRIKMISRSPQMETSPLAHVRFLAVSATIPNIDDLGKIIYFLHHAFKLVTLCCNLLTMFDSCS